MNIISLFLSGLTTPSGNCTEGYYCHLGAIDPNPLSQAYGDVCPEGHYCPLGTGTPIPCPIGTLLNDTGHSAVGQCLQCPPGKYCDKEGQTNYTGDCLAGFYCTLGANNTSPTDGSTGDVCPAGSYCPTGAEAPVPCADGQSSTIGLLETSQTK